MSGEGGNMSDAPSWVPPDGSGLSLPPPPERVSANGQEIWDWADKLSRQTAHRHKLRQLNADIAEVGRGCGDCDKWMKSSQCPREHNVRGQSRGPSMREAICCQFVEASQATARRVGLRAELAALTAGQSLESGTRLASSPIPTGPADAE